MTGIATLFRYTRYENQQRNSSTEELNQVIEKWNRKSPLAKIWDCIASAYTREDRELQAMAAKTILEERETSKSDLVQIL